MVNLLILMSPNEVFHKTVALSSHLWRFLGETDCWKIIILVYAKITQTDEQTDDDGGTVIKHFTVLGNLLKSSSAEIQAAILDWGKTQVQRR